MEDINQVSISTRAERAESQDPGQPDAWVPVTQKTRVRKPNGHEKIEIVQPGEAQPQRGEFHACKASQRGYQLARDHLKWADRDLGETAAFLAASLTTVTAVQAVIGMMKEQLTLSNGVLQLALHGYVGTIILILLFGFFRARKALKRRARAEREIDLSRKGIFEFCPMQQWPEPDE